MVRFGGFFNVEIETFSDKTKEVLVRYRGGSKGIGFEKIRTPPLAD